jgi:transcriptional regulator with XRE-family HTH domain
MKARNTLGSAVLELRKAIGWTQTELGARAEMSQSEVSRVEHGLLVDLSLERAEQLLSAMGARLILSVDARSSVIANDNGTRLTPDVRLMSPPASGEQVGRLRRRSRSVETDPVAGSTSWPFTATQACS